METEHEPLCGSDYKTLWCVLFSVIVRQWVQYDQVYLLDPEYYVEEIVKFNG